MDLKCGLTYLKLNALTNDQILRQRFNSIRHAAAFWILVAIRMYFNGCFLLWIKLRRVMVKSQDL